MGDEKTKMAPTMIDIGEALGVSINRLLSPKDAPRRRRRRTEMSQLVTELTASNDVYIHHYQLN